ncbi:MAG TPA: DNA methyltransferase, partial [Anaerolineae bacterium]
MYYPLRNYVRGVPANVAEAYIDALTAPGDLVVDPFAGTPTVARVAQRMGRRVISVESNPLWEWLARTMATLPAGPEIDAALAQLGDTLKDDVPLRVHIAQLYVTTCAACHQPTPADYFVHARNAGPMQRHYTCIHCGKTRDDPATEEDLNRASAFDARGMHYHLAFERLVPPDNLHADRIRKLLAVYTPRNLYALVTLTLKIDSLFHSTREHTILLLLLLHLLDRGTSFYASVDAAPQLSAHKQFIEFNLWREIEAAAHDLGRAGGAFEIAESAQGVAESTSPAAFVGR